jgi:membrane associated rhomboid family serine protease
MGIYDRDYYRKEGPSLLDPFGRRGRVVLGLIFVNVAIFTLQVLSGQHAITIEDGIPRRAIDPVTQMLALDVDKVWQGQVWRLLTYAFVHAPFGIWHIVFNMYALWMFGFDMEDLYGPREFLAFYLMAALCGGVAFFVTKIGVAASCLGASGAVLGVSVLCAIHYPTRVILIFGLLPIQLWVATLLFVGIDAWTFIANIQTGTAVAAHLGGAAFGLAYYQANIRLLNFLPDLKGWKRTRSRPQLRVFRDEESNAEPVTVAAPPAAQPSAEVDEQLEAKLDAVLEKVAQHGQSSLTEMERQILFRASEIYKRRRTP